jgi:hypothetical protein
MWNPASRTRIALTLALAAGVAFLGSAMMMKAGSAFPQLLAGKRTTDGQPGVLVLALVILLATVGALLLALAGKELLDLRRRTHAR